MSTAEAPARVAVDVSRDPSAEGPGPLIEPSLNPAAASWALFAGIALVMVGNGLQGSLLGVRSELEGFSAPASGSIMAAYFVGFLIGGRSATKALTLVGHIRVFAALASMVSAASLVHALAVHPLSWLAMRFATGLCMAGLYVVAESWINDLATNATRGRLLAVYMVVTMGGMAAGQFLLNVADPSGPDLFLLASILVSIALVPVVLSARGTPPTVIPERMSIGDLVREVPTGVTMSFLIGVAQGALVGMGAFYATRAGLSPAQVSIFMGAPLAGGFLFQWPVGSLSDRLPRRGLMLGIAASATALSAALLVVPDGGPLAVLAMFALGGLSFPLYSLAIAYTNDWIRPEQVVGASAALVTMTGLGAVLGPLLASGFILALGNRAYFLSLVLAHGAIALYLAWRVVFRDPLPQDRQGPFIPVPARASAMAMVVLGRRRKRLAALARAEARSDTRSDADAATEPERGGSTRPEERRG